MSTLIKQLNSQTSGHVPSSLVDGQIGINEADYLLFHDNAAGVLEKSTLDVLLASGSLSNAANLTWSFPSRTGFRMFRFDFFGMNSSATGSDYDLYAALSSNNGSTFSNTFDYAYWYDYPSGSYSYGGAGSNAAGAPLSYMASHTGVNAFADAKVYFPFQSDTNYAIIASTAMDDEGSYSPGYLFKMRWTCLCDGMKSSVVNAIKFFCSTGNLYCDVYRFWGVV